MTPRKICAVTSARADYGLLYWVLRSLAADPAFHLQIVATGMHLSPVFGMTVHEIERDGFRVDERVEMLLSTDTPVGVAKSLGLGVIGIAEALARLSPDLVLVLGDRFEIFAAAQAALILGMPLAHIAGGDVTEGAFDDAMRHGITKIAHLHFVTNEDAARRVLQMGEEPWRVVNTGSPGIDYITKTELLSRDQLAEELQFTFRDRNFVVTYHPTTVGASSATAEVGELLAALHELGPTAGIVFTRGNADPGSQAIAAAVDEFVRTHPNAAVYTSLGQKRYLSLLAQVDAMIGNSSSGLYEMPSFHKATVNVGDRQKGRLAAASVVHCGTTRESIGAAIETALRLECSRVVNPYGDGHAGEAIHAAIAAHRDFAALLRKKFEPVRVC